MHLLEELTGLEDQSEEEKLIESGEKTRQLSEIEPKLRYEKEGVEGREKHSETANRKPQEENQPKKKTRRSSSDTIEYLKEGNEAESALRREELKLKKKEQDEKSKKDEETAKRREDMMKMMAQQNQIMLQLISKLIHK